MPDSSSKDPLRPPLAVLPAPPRRAPFVMVPSNIVHNPDVSINARLLYVILLDYRTHTGGYPDQDHLATEMKVSRDTVQRALRELEELAIIRTKRGGRAHANTYEILVDTRVDDAAPMRSQTDDAAPMRHQVEDDAAPMRSQTTDDTAPMRHQKETPYIEKNVKNTPPKSPPRGSVRRKSTTPLPKDFDLSNDRANYGTALGYTLPEVEFIFAGFLDYAAEVDWRKVDWDATWRNWIRRQVAKTPPGHVLPGANGRVNGRAKPESASERMMRYAEIMEQQS